MSILAVDGGQSGVRARITDGGRIVGEADLPPIRTDLPVSPQLAQIAQTMTQRFGPADDYAIGTTGLTEVDSAAKVASGLEGTGISHVHLAHDSITCYLGALGDATGVVTASGTGVVTLAVGASDVVRVDGWGWIMGDCGSGFWIGRAGLEAGMRAHDGRGPATGMLDAIRRDFRSIEGAYVELQSDETKVARIASYAREVLDLAEAGDLACQDIAHRAALELAHSATTGLSRVGETDAPLVCGLGGVFRSGLVRQGFTDAIQAVFPGARVIDPQGTSLEGAALLPGIGTHNPLHARIDLA